MAYLRFYTEIFILCKMTKMKKKSSTQEGLKSRSRGDNVFVTVQEMDKRKSPMKMQASISCLFAQCISFFINVSKKVKGKQ